MTQAACTAFSGGLKSVNGSELRLSLTATASYTLTSPMIRVAVRGRSRSIRRGCLTVSLTATPTSVASGGSSTLNWSTTNASSGTATGGWSGAKGLNGSEAPQRAYSDHFIHAELHRLGHRDADCHRQRYGCCPHWCCSASRRRSCRQPFDTAVEQRNIVRRDG